MLLEVYFTSDREVISFCEHLFWYHKQIELHWKVHEEWGNHILLNDNLPGMETYETVAKSMVDVFVEHRLPSMIKDVIERVFYYTSTAETERILDLTLWIIAGDDEDSHRVRNNRDPCQVLKTLFITTIQQTSIIHFDSVIHFQLKPFKDQLEHYVGLAIDEFKREEEHQAFIHTVRNYVNKKKPKFAIVYILQGKEFIFFKPSGKPFAKMELRILMQEEPLYIVGLDENEPNLAPLVAMSPEIIKIYGDDPAEPKTLTIMNIFQERVEFEPYDHFPFTHFSKKE